MYFDFRRNDVLFYLYSILIKPSDKVLAAAVNQQAWRINMLDRKLCFVGVLCLLMIACQSKINYVTDGPKVSVHDFSSIAGDWVGKLTYTDYGSGEPTVITANASVTSISNTKIDYMIYYPNEPWEDSKSTLEISKDGRLLDGHVILERRNDKDGTLIVTTHHRGEDDNRPADIRQTYGLSQTSFYIQKDVKFADSNDYLMRNTYKFTRAIYPRNLKVTYPRSSERK
jgi:hypothetical protein